MAQSTDILKLAVEALVCIKTARKAVKQGASAIREGLVRERVVAAARRLGVELGADGDAAR